MGFTHHAQPRIWRARFSLVVWVVTFDLSGVKGLISNYATAIVALRIILPLQPCCFVKVRLYTGGGGFYHSA